jgi:hypothetical protein
MDTILESWGTFEGPGELNLEDAMRLPKPGGQVFVRNHPTTLEFGVSCNAASPRGGKAQTVIDKLHAQLITRTRKDDIGELFNLVILVLAVDLQPCCWPFEASIANYSVRNRRGGILLLPDLGFAPVEFKPGDLVFEAPHPVTGVLYVVGSAPGRRLHVEGMSDPWGATRPVRASDLEYASAVQIDACAKQMGQDHLRFRGYHATERGFACNH